MKRSTFFWNVIIFVLSLVVIFHFSEITHETYKYYNDVEYRYQLSLNRLYSSEKNLYQFNEVSQESPKNDYTQFVIDTLRFKTYLSVVFIILGVLHGLIILIANIDEFDKENEFSNFSLKDYFFIFSNPLTYYILAVIYLIPRLFKLIHTTIINFNNYLDSK